MATLNNFKDGWTFTLQTATQGPFTLLGGRYGIAVNATWGGGSAQLNILMPDGSTYIAAIPAFTADSTAVVDLPPGTYRVVITTATAVQMALIRIPYRPT